MSLRNPFVSYRLLALIFALAMGAISVSSCGRDAPNTQAEPRLETALEHAEKHMDPTYVCPMHPQVVGSVPGRCPICGMNLVPKAAEASVAGPQGRAVAEASPTVTVPAAVVNQLGVRTAKIRRGTLARHIKGFGTFLGTKARVYRPAYGTQSRSGDDKSASEMLLVAQIFERDAPLLRVGQALRVRFPSLGGREWTGNISGVETQISQTSHLLQFTGSVDLEGVFIPNGMTAMVTVLVEPMPDVLLVPREAVIVTGKGSRVMVAQGGGRFEQRAVDVEDFGEDDMVIRAGLKEGDRVAVSAQFLLDSEANLQAALTRLSGEPAEEMAHAPALNEGAAHERAMAAEAWPGAAMHVAEKTAETTGDGSADQEATKGGNRESIMSAGGIPKAVVGPDATRHTQIGLPGDHAGAIQDLTEPEAPIPAAVTPEPSVPQVSTQEGTMQ